jgi:hypothetical protein
MKVNPDGRRHRRKSMNAERRRTRDGPWSLTRCRLQGAMAHRRLQADQRRGSCRDFLNVRWQRRWRAAGTSSIGRIDAATGVVTTTPTTDGSTTVAPRSITVASDGQVWFTARFTPQAVGRLDPTTGAMTILPTPTKPGTGTSPRHRTEPSGSPRRPRATSPGSTTPASSPRRRPSRAANPSGSPSPPTATPGTPCSPPASSPHCNCV